MDLRQVATTTFVLLQATWSVEKSYHLVEQLGPSHVIVHSYNLQDAYYLFSAQEALALLERALNVPSVDEAFRLEERMTTPALAGDVDAESAPDQCIVLEEGHLLGFFDASVPPRPIVLRRGEGEDLSKGFELEVRSLVADFPKEVHLQETFSLLVFLSASPMPEADPTKAFALPVGAAVDIVVWPKRGVILEGPRDGTLVVSSEEETLPLQFKLRGVALGPGQLEMWAFHQGQPLAKLLLTIMILKAPATISAQSDRQEQSLEPVSLYQPDLQVFIVEQPEGTVTLWLTAFDPALGLNLKEFGPIHLKVPPRQYFQELFEDIERLPLGNDRERAAAEQHLASKGVHLFQALFPADLQRLLWSLQKRIKVVEVQSVEPWIPWELCKLCWKEDKLAEEGPFLCEAFAMTRWIPGIAKKPRLRLKNMAVVVPADSKLSYAPRELDYLLSLADNNRQVKRVPATFLELRKALAAGTYDGWHFSGHGSFRAFDPNRSRIKLENGETLIPEDLSGVVSNLGLATPFVFLNACQVGRSAMSLTDIGGWASAFLRAGAGAFVGAYWSIYDKSSFDFAQELYAHLLTNMPIGEAVQKTRAAIRKSAGEKPAGDPTRLAYTVFADPLAMVRK